MFEDVGEDCLLLGLADCLESTFISTSSSFASSLLIYHFSSLRDWFFETYLNIWRFAGYSLADFFLIFIGRDFFNRYATRPFLIKAVLQKFKIFVLPLDNNGAEMRQSKMSGCISISESSFSSEFILLALRASSINLFHSSFLRVLSTVHIYARSGRSLSLISGK